MTDLIAELERATEGSRELSDKVLLAVGWTRQSYVHPGLSVDYGEEVECWDWTQPNGEPCPREHMGGLLLPCPTTSVDAALTLMPEGWQYICMERYSDGCYVRLKRMSADHEHVVANQKPAALALCIAALKARQAQALEKQAVNG